MLVFTLLTLEGTFIPMLLVMIYLNFEQYTVLAATKTTRQA
jgi:hypothetical protein